MAKRHQVAFGSMFCSVQVASNVIRESTADMWHAICQAVLGKPSSKHRASYSFQTSTDMTACVAGVGH